jgi:hypothetical protein
VLFDRLVGRLQKELDSAMSRNARLAEDDAYEAGMDPNIPRPQPTSNESEGAQKGTMLYVEAPGGRVMNSAIRHDDIEVHLRI